MIKTGLKRFLITFSGVILLGLSSTVQAALVFVNESDGTHDQAFFIDSGDASTDFIDLEFGATLDAKLRFDIVNNIFSLNRNTDFGGNEIQNVQFESLAADPAVCDASQTARIYYNTTDNVTFVCNGTDWQAIENSAGATAPGTATIPLETALYRESLSTNINALATDNVMPWNIEDFEDSVFVHDNAVNNSRIQVTEAGRYLVSGAINAANDTTNNFRYNGRVKFRINGVTVLEPRFQPGYIRNATGQTETSLVYSLVLDLAANDFFEVLVDRENTNGSPATTIPNQSSLSIVQLSITVNTTVVEGGGGDVAPFVSNPTFELPGDGTTTISLEGTGFLPTTTVTIPGFTGTINSVTVVSPIQIDVNLTTAASDGVFDVVVTNGSIDNTFWPGNGVGLLDISFVTGTGVAGTLTEGFEVDTGSWVSSGLAADWTRDAGGTPSGGTGPLAASVGTFYLYTEATGANNPNVPFGIETTDFRVAQSISFDFHMFGAGTGTLEVQTLRSGVWTTRDIITGQQQAAQGDAYIPRFVDLSTFQVEAIRFLGTTGATFASDITIDNVVVISN